MKRLFRALFAVGAVFFLLSVACNHTKPPPTQFWVEAEHKGVVTSPAWNHRIDYRENLNTNPEVCFMEFRVELESNIPGPGQGPYCHVPPGENPWDMSVDTLDNNKCILGSNSWFDAATGRSVCVLEVRCEGSESIPLDNVERLPDLRIWMGDDAASLHHSVVVYPLGPRAIQWGTCADGAAVRNGGTPVHGSADVQLP